MILNLECDEGGAEIEVVYGFFWRVGHFSKHVLHVLLQFGHILYMNVIGVAVKNLGIQVLISVEHQERAYQAAVDVNFGVGDENHLNCAKNDQQDIEQ
jgi:hypothetical protein